MPLNYLDIISLYYPNVFCHCVGDVNNYNDIIWENGDPIPIQLELDNKINDNLKTEKIDFLSQECQRLIITGFTSDGLGSLHYYDSEQVDQLNLIGAVSATAPIAEFPDGTTMYYAVRSIVNNVIQPKEYKNHTHSQLRKVIFDGSVFKLNKLQIFNNKRDYIQNNVLTLEQINVITFESVE